MVPAGSVRRLFSDRYGDSLYMDRTVLFHLRILLSSFGAAVLLPSLLQEEINAPCTYPCFHPSLQANRPYLIHSQNDCSLFAEEKSGRAQCVLPLSNRCSYNIIGIPSRRWSGIVAVCPLKSNPQHPYYTCERKSLPFHSPAQRAVLRVQRAELSAEQAERVAEVVRCAKLQDNPSFAGTTEDGSFELIVDGVRVSVGFSADTELQYSWNGERRSVRAVSDGYAQALREIAQEIFSEIPG